MRCLSSSLPLGTVHDSKSGMALHTKGKMITTVDFKKTKSKRRKESLNMYKLYEFCTRTLLYQHDICCERGRGEIEV